MVLSGKGLKPYPSVPAMIALVSEKYYGWNWLDPVMGIAGGLVITGLVLFTDERNQSSVTG